MENTHLAPALAPAPGCFLFKCSSMQVVLPWKASSALHVLHTTAFFVWSFVKLSHTLLVRTLLHSIIIRSVCPSTGIAFRRAAYTLALQRRSGQIVILQALTLGHVIKRLLDNKNICRHCRLIVSALLSTFSHNVHLSHVSGRTRYKVWPKVKGEHIKRSGLLE